MAHNYRLQVTAGPAYDTSTHRIVPVNGSETMTIESEHMTIALAVRIQDYTGTTRFLSCIPKYIGLTKVNV